MSSIIQLQNLSKYFSVGGELHKAVDGITLDIRKGETLGIVGESGSGKTTLGRTLMRLYKPDQGQIFFEGKEITHLPEDKIRPMRKEFQMVFQNPSDSMSPHYNVGEILEEPLLIQDLLAPSERTNKAYEMLEKVGLPKTSYYKKLHEFSGGQRQRIGIARALVLNPKLLIADEPVSALDVSVQAQVLNLLKDLQKEMNLTCVFISHDLNVVHYMSDRVAVLYLGHLLEVAPKRELYTNPIHPYTKSLLSSIPIHDPELRNHSRKQIVLPEKSINPPHLVDVGNGHLVAADVINITTFETQKEKQDIAVR
ncbi:ABC transporter ATP-binding protein [Fictibacillus phosphorivorans]|uniref:ABC transporter ATP-binding protein n=1 Tax=Fictibacillus phosphorivorans TaxID=1221500 RepID=UPI00083577D7|nr:ATP-binding cassette domain-containing protein [Fictibacillus phosphorivorans]